MPVGITLNAMQHRVTTCISTLTDTVQEVLQIHIEPTRIGVFSELLFLSESNIESREERAVDGNAMSYAARPRQTRAAPRKGHRK